MTKDNNLPECARHPFCAVPATNLIGCRDDLYAAPGEYKYRRYAKCRTEGKQ